MPEGVGYLQTVAGTSVTDIVTIGKHAYLLTGLQSVDNNVTTIFDGRSGKGYMVCKFYPIYFQSSTTDNAVYQIYFNDILVYRTVVTDSSQYTPFSEVTLLIPPLTALRIESYNRTDTSTIEVGMAMTGELYL
jgi:hypothetical protein